MDIRLAAGALARLNLGAPAKARVASRVACQRRQLHLPATPYRQRTAAAWWGQRRDLSASSSRRALPAGASEANRPSPDSLAFPRQQQQPPAARRGRQMPTDEEIASIVDQSFQSSQNVAPRTSLFGQRSDRDQPTNHPATRHPRGNNTIRRPVLQTSKIMSLSRQKSASRSTVDMFESAMARDPNRSARQQNRSSAGFLDSFVMGATQTGQKDDFNVDDVVDDALGLTDRSTAVARPMPKSSLRLGSSVGRTIEVDPGRGIDLSRGISILDARLSANRVRYDYHKQKFHERPGLKRKRKASERWRRQFKAGFQHVVQRVQYLTKMGW